MRIGFDFDKVFVDYPPFIPSSIIDRLYKKKNHKLVYRFPSEFEQKIRILSHHWMLRSPIKKNIEVLSEITKINELDIFLISGRFGFLKNKTEIWLKRHKLKKFFKKMYFNFENEQPHLLKDKMIRKLKLTKFVDDDLDLLLYLSKRNPRIDFFWLKGTFPKKVRLPKNLVPIIDLREFAEKHLKNGIF